jgi:hypothetical protein
MSSMGRVTVPQSDDLHFQVVDRNFLLISRASMRSLLPSDIAPAKRHSLHGHLFHYYREGYVLSVRRWDVRAVILVLN